MDCLAFCYSQIHSAHLPIIPPHHLAFLVELDPALLRARVAREADERDALGDLDDFFVERGRAPDVEVEDFGAGLERWLSGRGFCVDSEGVGEGGREAEGREAEGRNALGRRRISKAANE